MISSSATRVASSAFMCLSGTALGPSDQASAGLFMETHPKPAEAWSDGPNAVPLKHMKALLETLVALDDVTKKNGFLENNFGA